MASAYECEIRYRIDDIAAFKAKLKTLRAKVSHYSFTDYYYRPKGVRWDPVKKVLRIRDRGSSKEKTGVYFVINEIKKIAGLSFKRSVFTEGKLLLYEGSLKECSTLLKQLDFEHWLTVKKAKGLWFDLPKYKFITVAEYIPRYGWSGELEFEGHNPKEAKAKFEKAIKLLGIKRNTISFKPISVLVAESSKNN